MAGGCLAVLLLARPAAGQLYRDSSTAWLVSAGSEGETYLRALQVAGLAQSTSWSVRPFSLRALRRMVPSDTGLPWAGTLAAREPRRVWIEALAPQVEGIFNSRFPYGMNDGPLWAGRGLTTSAMAGIQGGVGPLTFILAPQLFRAENGAFPAPATGTNGPGSISDTYNAFIDLPLRFGDRAYARVDPGNSSVLLTLGPAIVGVSTANESWGPAAESPFLLGNNAAGFAHLVLGTDGPVTLGPVTASLRVIAGRLEQSDYAPASPTRRRMLTGFIGTIGTRAIPGLELGVARLFHSSWPDSGLSVGDILRPLIKNPFKARLVASVGGTGTEPDNQLGSVFARWSFPESRVAVYGELGREDNAYDLRDVILEPDHDVTYLLGLERAWRRGEGRLLVVRAELLNTSISHLDRVRSESPPYVHKPLTQGHTQLGQVLGAPSGFGGGGAMIAFDWFGPEGRRGITWRRMDRDPAPQPAAKDVIHALTFDWLLFKRRVDLLPEATLAYNMNRYGESDVLNLRAALTGTLHW